MKGLCESHIFTDFYPTHVIMQAPAFLRIERPALVCSVCTDLFHKNLFAVNNINATGKFISFSNA